MASSSEQSRPGTSDAGGEASSSSWRKLRPRAPSEWDSRIIEWLNHDSVRADVETLMGVLGCTMAEAVMVMQLNLLIHNTDPENPEDSWGPGANSQPEEN